MCSVTRASIRESANHRCNWCCHTEEQVEMVESFRKKIYRNNWAKKCIYMEVEGTRPGGILTPKKRPGSCCAKARYRVGLTVVCLL